MSSRLSSSHPSHLPASLCHLWQPRHWWRVASVLMPRVTSALLARHEAHVLDGLGAMGTPHIQHRTFTMVPPPAAAPGGSIGSSMVALVAFKLLLCLHGNGSKMKGNLGGRGKKETASGTTLLKAQAPVKKKMLHCAALPSHHALGGCGTVAKPKRTKFEHYHLCNP